MNVWFDRIKMFPGDYINEEVKMAISNCKLFLPIITNQSINKKNNDYVRQEWKYFYDSTQDSPLREIKVIPLVYCRDVNLGELGFNIDAHFARPQANLFHICIDDDGLSQQDIMNIKNRLP